MKSLIRCYSCFWARKENQYNLRCILGINSKNRKNNCPEHIKKYSYKSRIEKVLNKKDRRDFTSKELYLHLNQAPALRYISGLKKSVKFNNLLKIEINRKKNIFSEEEIDKKILKSFSDLENIIKILFDLSFKGNLKHLRFNLAIGFSLYTSFIKNGLYLTQSFICTYFNISENGLRQYLLNYFNPLLKKIKTNKKEIKKMLWDNYPSHEIPSVLSFL